jgi:hypothetical protein
MQVLNCNSVLAILDLQIAILDMQIAILDLQITILDLQVLNCNSALAILDLQFCNFGSPLFGSPEPLRFLVLSGFQYEQSA